MLKQISSKKWDYTKAAHLLNRAGFGGPPAEIQKLAGLGLEGAALFLADLLPEGLPDEEVPAVYRLADALFLPSREEAFGIPLLEAGLSGLPIFCSSL